MDAHNLVRVLCEHMPGLLYYSTNPWFATDITDKYREGRYFAWVCECYDTDMALPSSAAAMIAPSSNPRKIYWNLLEDVRNEEGHSPLIKGYKKTFGRLARDWLGNGSVTQDQYDEINASVKSHSWRIWRPVLYIIPEPAVRGRLVSVRRPDRAGYGPEQQISDLRRDEFEIIELQKP